MFRAFLTAAALMGSTVLAQGATITQMQLFNGAGTLSFDGFDASLGTLTGVTAVFDIDASIEAGGMDARNPFIGGYSGTIDGGVTISGLPELSATYDIAGPTATCGFGLFFSNCRASFGGRTTSILFTPSVTDLSLFSSTIQAIIGFSTSVSTQVGSVRGAPSQNWTGSGSVTLTYDYMPVTPPSVVPLPAGAVLMVGGLGALSLLGLRRRRLRSS